MGQLKNERIVKRLALLSLIVSILITVLKWAAYYLTGSVALKSDAYEGIVNIVASAASLLAIHIARTPKDTEHPYGHGKVEYFSSAFEGGLITLAGLLIFYEAVKSFFVGAQIHELNYGLYLNGIAGLLNGGVAFYLMNYGKKFHSEALIADGKHLMSDFLTTLILFIGVLVIKLTEWYWLDSVLAFIVAILLLGAGYRIVKKSIDSLLDSQDVETIKHMIKNMNEFKTEDIISVHGLRATKSGHEIFSEMHVVVPEFYDVKKAHNLVERYTQLICTHAQPKINPIFHIDPCDRYFCKNCELSNCEIRQKDFDKKLVFNFDNVTKEEEEGS